MFLPPRFTGDTLAIGGVTNTLNKVVSPPLFVKATHKVALIFGEKYGYTNRETQECQRVKAGLFQLLRQQR